MIIQSLYALLLSFGKIGLIALGGGNSMLKLIEFEVISARHWVGQEEFIQMVGTTFLFPGLTGVKLAGLIGYKIAGIPGLTVAILALNLPGLILSLIGYRVLSTYNNPIVHKIMVAVQYGAIVLLLAATWSIAKGVTSLYFSWVLVFFSLLFLIGMVGFEMSPFWGFIAFIGLCFFFVH